MVTNSQYHVTFLLSADVANSIGSFCAALYVYNNLAVPPSNAEVYQWVLALGGCGIVIGLATYGKLPKCLVVWLCSTYIVS